MKRSDEHKIEWIIRAGMADSLELRPNERRYARAVLKDGASVDLNKPGPFASPDAHSDATETSQR